MRGWRFSLGGTLVLLVLGCACLPAGTTLRMSETQQGLEASGESYHPTISADGRRVCFTTSAANLSPSPGIHLRDTQTGSLTFLVEGRSPTLSADGNFLAYRATEPSGEFTTRPVARVRRLNGGTETISIRADGHEFSNTVYSAGISYDGRSDSFRCNKPLPSGPDWGHYGLGQY